MKANAALITLFSEHTDESETEYRYVFHVAPLSPSEFRKEDEVYRFDWRARIAYGNGLSAEYVASGPECSSVLKAAAIGHECWRPEGCNGHWQMIAWQEDLTSACGRLLANWKSHVDTLVSRFQHDTRIEVFGNIWISAETHL